MFHALIIIKHVLNSGNNRSNSRLEYVLIRCVEPVSGVIQAHSRGLQKVYTRLIAIY